MSEDIDRDESGGDDDDDEYDEDEHFVIFKNGLRLAKPYRFDFIANVKKRWTSDRYDRTQKTQKTIVDVFYEEFPNLPRTYYEDAYYSGRLRVEKRNDNKNDDKTEKRVRVGAELPPPPVLIAGERVRHLVHKHEPPVLCSKDEKIEILKEINNICAVRKPATVPVHPTGQYRMNSVVEILALERATKKLQPSRLLPIHRLDRNVSGLLLMAKTSEAAKLVTDLIVANKVRKEYVARVRGLFPETKSLVCETPLGFCNKTHIAIWNEDTNGNDDGDHNHHRSSSSSSAVFKYAKTTFTLIKHFPDSNESLIQCNPETGRTHQIRAHLKLLGFPIANDVLYGGQLNNEQERLQEEYQRICDSFKRFHRHEKSGDYCDDDDFECPHCPLLCWFGSRATHDLEAIYLFCLKYTCDGVFDFECHPLPKWSSSS
jgi:tRNA pseudouridine32 synthase